MKTPTLIRSLEHDLANGHAGVIQIVSTGEALMERRLAEIPTEEWNDVRVDITPREYVLDYLAHSFPVQLYEPFTDSEGNLSSRPVRSEEHTSELQSLMRISYAVFCLKKKKTKHTYYSHKLIYKYNPHVSLTN